MASITLQNLAHSYAPNPQGEADFALKEVNLKWGDGEAYALLGPSGCGKTTLLNIMSGLLTPTRGRVLFDERDVTAAPTAERNIAQVFQFPVVYDTMSVRENLAFPLRNRGVDAGIIAARVDRIADMIGLTPLLGKKAQGLGADLKQKISLGRGMVRDDVNAILFDEPLTVIDPHLKWELRTQLKALHREFGHTMVYVTHDQTEALTFADKVVVMNEGRVLQIGTPQELFETPAHRFVGYFIGSPGMNFLPATIDGAFASIGGERVDLGKSYGSLEGAVEIGIRPEFVKLTSSNGLPLEINRIQDAGRQKFVNGNVFGAEVNIVMDASEAIDAGMTRLAIEPAKISVFQDGWRVEPKGAE
ncbi:ABC transporter ATP-binding protein [Erythrobacter longus]|uniref:ABC transporter ATP-binding protein n=1 Tax=Erythrobacter longus TaxID=1044 RepID=A0A074M5R5_ERYLO|nr:ABC transporter ATP-binding protein [Erythrobacter longus]KEO90056.1 ABC transporter ATP-binding protein [Erythrobacter longus]